MKKLTLFLFIFFLSVSVCFGFTSDNNYTDEEQEKIAGIEEGAEVNPPLVPQAVAEAGTSESEYSWSPLRIFQAITAYISANAGSLFGVDDAPSDGTGYVRKDGSWAAESEGGTGDGDVTGPEGATAGNFPILDATGKILSDSGKAPADFLESESDPGVTTHESAYNHELIATAVQTESDPITGAINGIVKADGAGNISAAVEDTDYQGVLLEGAFADGDKTKLDGIAEGAEVNVQSDWDAVAGDALILNKPTIPSGNAVLDWTADQDPDDIHANNIPDLTGRTITLGDETSPTTEGVIGWDATLDQIEVGDGSATKVFLPEGEDGSYAPALGSDDNYVTDAEKIVIGNTSNTNTGDDAVNTTYDTDGDGSFEDETWFPSSSSGSGFTRTEVEADFTIEPNYYYAIKPVANITGTTSATPTAGDTFGIYVPYLLNSFTADLDFVDEPFHSDSVDNTVDNIPAGAYAQYTYVNSTVGWYQYNDGINDYNLAAASDTTAPTFTSAAVGTDGETYTFGYDENVNIGTGGSGGHALTWATAGAISFTYSAGDGTDTLTYTGTPVVNSGDTVSVGLNYTQPTDGLEDDSGNDLASFTSESVTNNSEQGTSVALGEDTTYGTEVSISPNVVCGIAGTATASGNIATGYFYVRAWWGLGTGEYIKMLVYQDSDDSLIATSAAVEGGSQSVGWVSFTFSSGSITSGNSYHIGVIAEDYVNAYSEAGGSGTGLVDTSGTYDNPPDPLLGGGAATKYGGIYLVLE